MVPAGGGRFAWVTPKLIQVGDWNNDRVQKLEPEEGMMLKGFNGFVPLAFNPDGTKLAWCDATGQARYWDLEHDRVQALRVYPAAPGFTTGTEHGAWGLVFSPDGTKVATIGIRGVLLQNVYTGWRWFAENDPAREKLTAFAFNHNGFEMAVGLSVRPEAVKPLRRNRNGGSNGNGPAGVATNGAKPAAYPDVFSTTRPVTEEGPVEGSPEDKWTNVVRLWDLRAADYHDLVAGESPIREIAFSPDNRMLAAVDEAGHLRLWDIAPEGSVGRLPRLVALTDLGITGRKVVLAFSPDIERLISATDNRILIWNLARVRQECKV